MFPQLLILEEHLGISTEVMPPGWVPGTGREKWTIWLPGLTIHSDLPLKVFCLALNK